MQRPTLGGERWQALSVGIWKPELKRSQLRHRQDGCPPRGGVAVEPLASSMASRKASAAAADVQAHRGARGRPLMGKRFLLFALSEKSRARIREPSSAIPATARSRPGTPNTSRARGIPLPHAIAARIRETRRRRAGAHRRRGPAGDPRRLLLDRRLARPHYRRRAAPSLSLPALRGEARLGLPRVTRDVVVPAQCTAAPVPNGHRQTGRVSPRLIARLIVFSVTHTRALA
jgi:hypothetical protein